MKLIDWVHLDLSSDLWGLKDSVLSQKFTWKASEEALVLLTCHNCNKPLISDTPNWKKKKKKKAAKAIFNQVFQTSVMKRMPFLSLTTLSDWRKTSRHLRTHSVGGDAFSRAYSRLHIYLLYDWLPSLSSSTVISQSNYGNFGLRRPNESHDREDSVVPLACLIALRTESRSCHSLIRPWCVMRCNLLCMTKLPHADTAILRARDVCKQKSKKIFARWTSTKSR